MPVDFSMVGLDGIKAGQDTLTAIETRKQMSALTRGKEIENYTEERDIELGNEAAARLAQIASGKSDEESHLFDGITEDSSDAAPLEIMGKTFIMGGSSKQGMEYLKAAADIRKKEQEIGSAKITDRQNKLENVVKVSDIVSKTVGIARNDSEWKWGLQQLREQEILPPEQLEQLEAMDYDPDVVTYINEQALTAYNRAYLDLQSSEKDFRRNLDERKFQNTQEQTEIAQERLRLAQVASNRVERQGVSASAPSENEVKQVSSAITNEVFKGKVPKGSEAAVKAGAAAIAARTKQLVKEDKSLDWDTALNRSIIESVSNGDWSHETTQETFLGIGVGGKTRNKSTFNVARPLPLSKDGKPNPNAFRKGQTYITARGKATWDGTGLIPIE